MQETRFDPGAGKIPWKRAGQPTPVFSPGDSHGQRSLAGFMGLQRLGHDRATNSSNSSRWTPPINCLFFIFFFRIELFALGLSSRV